MKAGERRGERAGRKGQDICPRATRTASRYSGDSSGHRQMAVYKIKRKSCVRMRCFILVGHINMVSQMRPLIAGLNTLRAGTWWSASEGGIDQTGEWALVASFRNVT